MNSKDLFIDNHYSCSETIIRIANEKYNLGILEDDLKLLSSFGGGMGYGGICGCLAAAEACLGKKYCGVKDHETDGFRDRCAAFAKEFDESFGGMNCKELKPKHAQPEIRCLNLIDKTLLLLDKYMK